MKRKNSKQKKASSKMINEKIVPLMIIFVMIFYPLLFPLWIIQAEEELVATTNASEDIKPAPIEKEDPPKDAEEEAPAEEPTKVEEKIVEETVSETETNSNQTTQAEISADSATNDNSINQNQISDSETAEESIDLNLPEQQQEESTLENETAPIQQDPANVCCDVDNNCCSDAAIENDNDAEISNTADSISNTGNNSINDSQNTNTDETTDNDNDDSNESTSDQSTNNETEDESAINSELENGEMSTGNAIADNTIVNEANTNIVSENYIDSVINITGDESYDINLLEQFQNLLGEAEKLNTANLEALTIENNNTANITNDIQIIANSGENTIAASEETEDAQIATGDATADSNIINIINRNLIGNTWIFSVINVLGNWVGDLIVPGEGLLETPTSQLATNLEIINENEATIVNNSNTNADSGGNLIADAENSLISTGITSSSSEITNVVNTNIIQNNWFVLLINNLGVWSGKILGWDEADDEKSNVYEYNFETNTEEDFLTSMYSFLSIHNINQATITNNASASATTGNNSITGGGENATIQTGNASASTNIVNIANTNIVGNNWIFAIVNVMGSWTGNTVFAYPDLALSISDGIQQVNSGGLLTYTVSYENIGQANCDDAQVSIELPDTLTYQSSSAQQLSNAKNSAHIWSLGKINAGEKKSFAFTVIANNNGETAPTSVSATISTNTKETELLNNSASDETIILSKQMTSNELEEFEEFDPDSHLKISRPAMDYPSVPTGNIVEQFIYVENDGDDPLGNIVVTEAVINPNDEIVGKYLWNIPVLNKNEKVIITYQLMIGADAAAGTYTYRARGVAVNSIGEKVTSNKALNNLIVFAMYYNNKQDATDFSPTSINTSDIINYDNKNILGAATTNNKAAPLWLLVTAILIYTLTGVAWLLSKKLNLETITLKENLLKNRTDWGTVHKIYPRE